MVDDGERPLPTDDHEGTIGVVALDHLSHAHSDRDVLMGWYERVFGMQLHYRAPEDERCFLERRGTGIHHVTFEVGDWERAIAACETYGVTAFEGSEGVRDGWGWAETFIHPREAGGVLGSSWGEHPGDWI